MGRKSLVEVGQIYGRLTVLRKKAVKMWECQCECGNVVTVCSSPMLRGNTRSCGCYRDDKRREKLIHIEGERYGKLVALREVARRTPDTRRFECQCDCGELTIVDMRNLRFGITKSCGCRLREIQEAISIRAKLTPARSEHPLYPTWKGMLKRCNDPGDDAYKNYGGRGIQVCHRWTVSFEDFLEDIGNRPNGAMIERKNNHGNYEPSNCKWATATEQVRNRRNTVIVELQGESKPLAEWCEIFNISYKLVHGRIHTCGWSLERALTTPVLTASEAGKLQRR